MLTAGEQAFPPLYLPLDHDIAAGLTVAVSSPFHLEVFFSLLQEDLTEAEKSNLVCHLTQMAGLIYRKRRVT